MTDLPNPFSPPEREEDVPSRKRGRPLAQTILAFIEMAIGASMVGFSALILVRESSGPLAFADDSPAAGMLMIVVFVFALLALFVFVLPGWALLRGIRWPQVFPAAYTSVIVFHVVRGLLGF